MLDVIQVVLIDFSIQSKSSSLFKSRILWSVWSPELLYDMIKFEDLILLLGLSAGSVKMQWNSFNVDHQCEIIRTPNSDQNRKLQDVGSSQMRERSILTDIIGDYFWLSFRTGKFIYFSKGLGKMKWNDRRQISWTSTQNIMYHWIWTNA